MLSKIAQSRDADVSRALVYQVLRVAWQTLTVQNIYTENHCPVWLRSN
jgi:hypothetical protein